MEVSDTIRCIAIDDEPVALSVIAQFCKRAGNMELECFSDPVEGFDRVRRTEPDIVFLDIEMGEFSGLEMAKRLPKGVFLIFTTAYARFAVEGFELDAVDFLHKPFSYARFEKAVQKACNLRSLQRLAAAPVMQDEEIVVKMNYRSIKVRLSDIVYIESLNNYVNIHLADGQTVASQMSMKSLEELLPERNFIRIHKSFIVPVHRVSSYTRNDVVLNYRSVTLPVGRTYIEKIKEILGTFAK